jgi:hypothetical protein
MKFKIRNNDYEGPAEYERCQKAYFRHLKKFPKSFKTDLWKFFAWDFFHDGHIKSIVFKPDLKTVVITMDGPNIEGHDESGKFIYLSADFTCTFYNVIRFTIEDTHPAEWPPEYESRTEFIASEINTRIPKGLPGKKDDFHSLLIETCANHTIWIEIVFSHVHVNPLEPVAFAMMETDPRYFVPTWPPRPESPVQSKPNRKRKKRKS